MLTTDKFKLSEVKDLKDPARVIHELMNVQKILLDQIEDMLIPRYREPNRFYHGEKHIRSMLDSAVRKETHKIFEQRLTEDFSDIEKAFIIKTDVFKMKVIIWFHDAVYVDDTLLGHKNERRSFDLFNQWFQKCPYREIILNSDPMFVNDIETAILDSGLYHVTNYITRDTNLFSKCLRILDLEIFEENGETISLEEYESGVRFEYSHVPDGHYYLNRVLILESIKKNYPEYEKGIVRLQTMIFENDHIVSLAEEAASFMKRTQWTEIMSKIFEDEELSG